MERRPLPRLLLEGLLVGLLPPAAVMGGLIGVFGVTRVHGHGGGGIDLFYYMLVAALVWLVALVGLSASRPARVAGVMSAFARGAAAGLGALLVLLAVQLGWGQSMYIEDFAELAEDVLLPGLALMVAVGVVSSAIWFFALRSAGPPEACEHANEPIWGRVATVVAGLCCAAVALGVLVLFVGAWSSFAKGSISGLWIAPLCGVPALVGLWAGAKACHRRLGDRAGARLFGGSYAAGAALVFLIWYVVETSAREPLVLALLAASLALVSLGIALLSGSLWSRRAMRRG